MFIYISSIAVSLALRSKSSMPYLYQRKYKSTLSFSAHVCWCTYERKLFWHSVLNIREILCVLFFRKLTYIALWQSVNFTMSKKSLPRVIPPYRCEETDGTQHACAELKNRTHAHPRVRLGHGSKDTAHVRVGTSYNIWQVVINRHMGVLIKPPM